MSGRDPGPRAHGAGRGSLTAVADGAGARSADGHPLDDHALHATEPTTCVVCEAPVREGWPVRVTPQGVRHDTCP